MKHLYKLFLALLVLSTAISCSKDDRPETAQQTIEGGEILAMQVVTVPMPGINLAQEDLNGEDYIQTYTLNDEALNISASSEDVQIQ